MRLDHSGTKHVEQERRCLLAPPASQWRLNDGKLPQNWCDGDGRAGRTEPLRSVVGFLFEKKKKRTPLFQAIPQVVGIWLEGVVCPCTCVD